MFEIRRCTPIGGDCCAGYEIRLEKGYTVSEFIETVLKERINEWGYISIKKKDAGVLNCGYKYGKIISEQLPKEVLSKHINRVSASGGWTRMDYKIELRE